MVNEEINWVRVLACGGLAFFSSFPANIITQNSAVLETSLITATIMAGIALFTELKLESYGTTGALQEIANKGLIV